MLEQLTNGDDRLCTGFTDIFQGWFEQEWRTNWTIWDQLHSADPGLTAPDQCDSARDSAREKGVEEGERAKQRWKATNSLFFQLVTEKSKWESLTRQHPAEPKGLNQESCSVTAQACILLLLPLHNSSAGGGKRRNWKLTDLFIWTSAILIES